MRRSKTPNSKQRNRAGYRTRKTRQRLRPLEDATGQRPVVLRDSIAPGSMVVPMRTELVSSAILTNTGNLYSNRSIKVSDAYAPFSTLSVVQSPSGFSAYLGSSGSNIALYQQHRVLSYEVEVDIANTQTFPVLVGGFVSNSQPSANSVNILGYVASGLRQQQFMLSQAGGGNDKHQFKWTGIIQNDVGSLTSRLDDSYSGTGGSISGGPTSPLDNVFLTFFAYSGTVFTATGLFMSIRLKLDTLVFERALPID